MYHPTTRVLTTLELLQSHQALSGPALAARLEVDARTVRRYIAMLQDLGIPVEAARGRYGGYRLRPGYKLPPLMFTEDEALALTLGLQAARRLGLAVAAPAVEGALAKVERVMPATLRERVGAVQETLVLDISVPDVAPAGGVVVTLSAAAQRRRRVWLRYRAWQAAETERAVDPYGLVYRAGYWYTVGYCHLRAGLRVFRLDRITHAELRDEPFSRPADFDSLAYVQRSLATMPAAWSVEVLLETTPEEAPGGVVMRCDVGNLRWIALILARLECPFVVRRPAELREELRRLAADLVALAGRGEG